MRTLYIALLLIFAVQISNCHAQVYNEPAYLNTNYDSLINANQHLLILPKECILDSGKVFIQFKVKTDGTVIDAKVIKGIEGCRKIDSIALDLIENFRFTPAVKEGKKVEVYKITSIPFRKG